jgi:hypothetical protein
MDLNDYREFSFGEKNELIRYLILHESVATKNLFRSRQMVVLVCHLV